MNERNRAESFNREKYLSILENHGLSEALSVLHRDIEQLEFHTFEGREGWKPEDFEHLKQIRAFSRELWNIQLNNPEKAKKH